MLNSLLLYLAEDLKMHKYTLKFEELEGGETDCGYANNRSFVHTFFVHDEDVWDVPLKSLTDFLGAIYGYDISNQIHVETILNNGIFKHIPKDNEMAERIRNAFKEFDEEDDLK
jgi:hypothetical protein